MYTLKQKKNLNSSFNSLIIATLLVIHFMSCGSQPKSKESEQSKSTAIQAIPSASSTTTDSLVYNQYKDGKKEGLWKEWWANGKLSSEGTYVNGKANGLMKWYSEKGHLAAFGNMIDGKRNGEWKICDWQDSTFCTTGHFKDEVEHGSWNSYYDNGQLERENVWENGQLIYSTCWDENGHKVSCN